MIKKLILIISLLAFASATDININKSISKAKKQDKHILIFVHTPYCGYCKRMKKTTLNADIVTAKIKKDFIFVDIDVSQDGIVYFNDFKGSKKEFKNFLGLEYYPSTFFVNKEGEDIYDQAGYQDRDTFLNILNFVSKEAYEEIGIEDFKDEN